MPPYKRSLDDSLMIFLGHNSSKIRAGSLWNSGLVNYFVVPVV